MTVCWLCGSDERVYPCNPVGPDGLCECCYEELRDSLGKERIYSPYTPSAMDNPYVLGYVKEEFARRWPEAAETLEGPESRAYRKALCLWLGFKKGIEFCHDLEPSLGRAILHRVVAEDIVKDSNKENVKG